MAGGVVEGVQRVAGTSAVLKKVDEVNKQDLESADASSWAAQLITEIFRAR
jgi:hypothetical protein